MLYCVAIIQYAARTLLVGLIIMNRKNELTDLLKVIGLCAFIGLIFNLVLSLALISIAIIRYFWLKYMNNKPVLPDFHSKKESIETNAEIVFPPKKTATEKFLDSLGWYVMFSPLLALLLLILIGIGLNALGVECTTNEAGIHPCVVFGVDIGKFLYDTLLFAAWGFIITFPAGIIVLAFFRLLDRVFK